MACGCNKLGDGIDTDVLYKLPKNYIKVLQKISGRAETGIYDGKGDKLALKNAASQAGMRLRDFIELYIPKELLV